MLALPQPTPNSAIAIWSSMRALCSGRIRLWSRYIIMVSKVLTYLGHSLFRVVNAKTKTQSSNSTLKTNGRARTTDRSPISRVFSSRRQVRALGFVLSCCCWLSYSAVDVFALAFLLLFRSFFLIFMYFDFVLISYAAGCHRSCRSCRRCRRRCCR